ncbi:MAG: TerB N-terminal domain-containing protein, partial [archaeon]|nr:TerB N-terminal domain-containing protein [archaeon]
MLSIRPHVTVKDQTAISVTMSQVCRPDVQFEKFVEEAKVYAEKRGTFCRYEPNDVFRPTYSGLTENVRSYYLWWRTCLSEGTCLRTDRGYVMLFLGESIALGRETSDILDTMKLIDDSENASRSMLHSIVLDLCIYKRCPIPQWIRYIPERLVPFWNGYVLSPGSHQGHRLLSVVDDPVMYGKADDVVLRNAMVDQAYHAIDEHLLDTTGRGFMTTFSEGEVRFAYHPFAGYGLPDCGPVVLTGPKFGNLAMNMFKGIYACCRRKALGDGSDIPPCFPKEYRAIVDGVPTLPFRHDPCDKVPVYAVPCDGTQGVGVLYSVDRADRLPSDMTLEEIHANWSFKVEGPMDYVPSGFRYPSYKHMSIESKAYFFHWRHCVRNGTYPPTDLGYMWLYCCELVNSPEDPARTYERFYRVTEAYCSNRSGDKVGRGFDRSSVCRLCTEYALYHGLPLLSTEMCKDPETMCRAFRQFLDDGSTPPDERLLIMSAELKDDRADSVDRDVTAIVNRVLTRLNRDLDGKLLSVGQVRTAIVEDRAFRSVRFFRSDDWFSYSIPDIMSCKYWRDGLRELILAVVAHVRLHRRTARKAPKKCVCFGIAVDGIVEEEVGAYFRTAVLERKMSLDLSKVAEAQRLLDEVTEMMTVPEETVVSRKKRGRPAKKTVKAPAVKERPTLEGSLDKVQTEYLKAL